MLVKVDLVKKCHSLQMSLRWVEISLPEIETGTPIVNFVLLWKTPTDCSYNKLYRSNAIPKVMSNYCHEDMNYTTPVEISFVFSLDYFSGMHGEFFCLCQCHRLTIAVKQTKELSMHVHSPMMVSVKGTETKLKSSKLH